MPKLTMVLNKVGKTINLAKTNTYQIPRKPPLNTLIFEKLPEPRCGDKITSGIKLPPHTKPVKICTKEDLQAFYCPTPCDCEIKPQPLTWSQKVGILFKQAMKALLVGGIIYYTYKEGVWSDAFRATCFIGKFIETCPEEEEEEFNEFQDLQYYSYQDPGPCYPFIPRTGYMFYRVGYYWNKTVAFIFWFILDGPFFLWELFWSFFKEKTVEKRKEKTCEEVQ